MSLIKAAGVQKTVTGIGRCYDKLVKEFIVNIDPEVGEPGHVDYFKVYVGGLVVEFSPATINKLLGRSEESVNQEDVTLKTMVKKLTTNQETNWPATATIPSS